MLARMLALTHHVSSVCRATTRRRRRMCTSARRAMWNSERCCTFPSARRPTSWPTTTATSPRSSSTCAAYLSLTTLRSSSPGEQTSSSTGLYAGRTGSRFFEHAVNGVSQRSASSFFLSNVLERKQILCLLGDRLSRNDQRSFSLIAGWSVLCPFSRGHE